ncbi:membrane protein [Azorhizobium oxalatiphilum]|uniref:Membrane protein n=1 Tax=Azorhizobium oxalatiphilum TaxID=980631 RepID=A0A917C800_9HYPH|nr:AsmA-like C-terminal region-containing protein [Azorhizobium oxalatiphilum]GGF75656.1 membrane protein [Azorhizobium oxalatiphilum]
MQAILIGLASAVILVIGAAFSAPFVVDWTQWRSTFEAEASRILGLPVEIRGTIEADILPSPHLVLRNVAIGTDEAQSGATMRELRADLSLGALLRGDVEASNVTLVRPALRVVLDASGRVTPPKGTRPAAGLSIAQFTIDQGTLDLRDRGAGRTVRLTDLSLKGEARSTLGPFRLEGDGTASGERYALRVTLGKIGEEGGRLRFIADGRSRPFSLDLDGTLRTASGMPQFEGKGTLLRRGEGAGTDAWRLSATVRMSPEAVVADTLDLVMGDDARPVQLSGSARLSLGRAVGLDAVLNARSLDLDALRALPVGTQQTPGEALAGLAGAFAELPAPEVTSRIGVAVDQLTVGGTVVRDARADLTGSSAGWHMDTAEAKLPGQTALRLSGVPARTGAASAGLGGDLLLTSEDPAAFLRWAAPRAAPEYAAAVKGPVRIAGRINAEAARYAVTGLDARFGPARLSGDGTLDLKDITAPRLDLKLALDGADLDPLIALGRKGLGDASLPLSGAIALDGQSLTLSGLPLRRLALAAEGRDRNWTLTRFTLDDLVGLKLAGTGQMRTGSAPTGQLALTLSGTKADGLVPVSRLVAGSETADVIHRLLPVAAPVELTAQATWGEKGAHSLTATGTLGQLEGRAAFARTDGAAPSKVSLAVTAADGAKALEAAGLPGLRQGLGPARIDLAIDPRSDGTAGFDGRVALGGATASGTGTVRLNPEGALLPTLDMRLDGPDLARLLAADLSTDGPVPGSLTFALSRAGALWRFDTLTGTLGGAPLSGQFTLEAAAVPRIDGRLETESLSVPRLMGLWSARSVGPDVGTGAWSNARFSPAIPAPAAFALDLNAKRIELSGPYRLTDGHLRIVADSNAFELRDVSGGLGSGHVAGAITLRRRGDALQADGRISVDSVESGVLLGPLGLRTPPRGRVSFSLDAVGMGRTPQAIVQALSGQGTVSVQELEIPGVDPKAIDSVMAETAIGQPPDERRITAMYDRALQRGPLKLEQLEGTFGLVNGVARLSPARAITGNTNIAVSGTLDLARLLMDVTLEQEGRESPGTLPGGTIAWRGPLAAPERRVTSTALTGVISMRAIERETRRLEERQNAPLPAVAPPPPAQPQAAPMAPAPATPAPAPISAPPVPPAPSPAPAVPAPTVPAPTTASPVPPPNPAPAATPPAPTPRAATPTPPPRTEPRAAEIQPSAPLGPQAAPALPPPVDIGPAMRPRMEPAEPEAIQPPMPIQPFGGFGILMRPPASMPE